MNGVLGEASHEWATRPADQRFASLRAMYLATFMAAQESNQTDINPQNLRVVVQNGGLNLEAGDKLMNLSHYAFNQLSARIGAPAPWLRNLHKNGRTDLVAQNLNVGLQTQEDGDLVQMYHRDTAAGPKLLALTSTKYGRIYNHEVIETLMNLPGNWRTPPAMPSAAAPTQPSRIATLDDVGPWTNIQVGERIVDSGLYASDKDMFAFLIDPDHRINDGTDQGLSRGFFVSNSEVGDATFTVTRFYFRFVCRNNNVWGTNSVQGISVKHLGRNARTRAFDKLGIELKAYAESSAEADESRIKAAQSLVLGKNLEEVTELIFNTKRITSKRNVASAYEIASQHETEDGNPNTGWGLAQGLTRLSQLTPYTDERVELDAAAGEVLALAE